MYSFNIKIQKTQIRKKYIHSHFKRKNILKQIMKINLDQILDLLDKLNNVNFLKST